jgi:hypothetical protein
MLCEMLGGAGWVRTMSNDELGICQTTGERTVDNRVLLKHMLAEP